MDIRTAKQKDFEAIKKLEAHSKTKERFSWKI